VDTNVSHTVPPRRRVAPSRRDATIRYGRRALPATRSAVSRRHLLTLRWRRHVYPGHYGGYRCAVCFESRADVAALPSLVQRSTASLLGLRQSTAIWTGVRSRSPRVHQQARRSRALNHASCLERTRCRSFGRPNEGSPVAHACSPRLVASGQRGHVPPTRQCPSGLPSVASRCRPTSQWASARVGSSQSARCQATGCRPRAGSTFCPG
jgi:hypothetical protein